MSSASDLDQLAGLLKDYPYPLQITAQIDSTNHWLLEHGSHGAVCMADQQNAGRGRRGRVWQSPQGVNLYLSLRWHFQIVPKNYSWLSLMVAVVIAEVLQRQGIHGHQIKWPNDLYYQGKKFGGILLQTSERLEQVVIGIGLNINMASNPNDAIDQPWCSLQMLTGHKLDRASIAAALVRELSAYLERFERLDLDSMLYAWQRWDMLSQCSVVVQSTTHTLTGIACGLDSQGRLLVLDHAGTLHTFSSADVSVRL
ncbi:MAG: biotin--[acetyl-CoA-carboxylase] ligase [Thiofilum sp.]|uniref:biotin--[acetyl-CoA-carboxylase] ligase n=1 Tax=Thiofilum sp. TaxID=2212733 RepID=UPI0025E1EFF8|nr:biotin--[acetyl-CoA-carboxylase] ligase [Thiofilum sp.]MBK8451992.1 biotin--[acetyl-CoA-carboxylase] ligase [Thiofilum sp.]